MVNKRVEMDELELVLEFEVTDRLRLEESDYGYW